MPKKKKGKGRGKERATQEEEQQQQPTTSTTRSQDSAQRPVHTQEREPEEARPSTSQETEVVERETDVYTSHEALSSFLEQSLTFSTPFVKRPPHGTRGRKIALTVNYFPVELPDGNVYHYDVEISLLRRDQKESASKEDSEKKKFRCMNTKQKREVIDKMFRHNVEFSEYIPAYDGEKNLYTKIPLRAAAPIKRIVELAPSESSAHDGEPLPRGDKFEVVIKPVIKRETNDNSINLDMIHALYERRVNNVALEAIMALETIMRNGPCFRYVPITRSFFYPPSPDDMHPLSGGKEIWFGHHQSLILTEWQPIVNINVTATTFRRSEPLIDYVCEIINCSETDLLREPGLRDSDIVQLSKKLKNVKIKVTHLRYEREYRVLKLTREPARDLRFSMVTSTGQPKIISVTDYFSQNYHKTLKFPHMPCLQVRPEAKKIYLPLEVCKIVPGQHSNERLTEEQTREMIKVASLPPDPRFRKIRQVLSDVQFNRDPCNQHFGIKVSPNPLSVEGRVIEPPNIMYHNERRVRPRDGTWDMKSEQFFRGAEVKSWAILSFANERFCTEFHLRRFGDMLCSVGLDCGLMLGRLEFVGTFGGRNVQVARELEAIQRKFQEVKLAVIVLQNKNSPLYAEVKQVSEIRLGLVTQCVLSLNVTKSNRSVIKNICLKINAKMDGINCSLTPGERPVIFNKPVIIFGADVTHPPPGSNLKPSIAAVVASLDSHPSRYAVEFRAQRHTKEKKRAIEIIDDIEAVVKKLLVVFYRETRYKPEKIIFFRDGVSKGEFGTVRDYELCAIRNACKSLDANYKPGITFIIVQKRHHTRFIPQDLRDGVGPRRNVPPGTVVDKGASSIMDFDFFLCSQFGLQGTSRPGHYTVISDDNKFTSDEIQKLTYYLCYIYARCTRSISVPAPVAYANLAAYRASKYVAAQLDESSASSSDMSASEIRALWDTWINAINVKPELKNKLFYV